ncbi:MAG: alkaline shock response membrane anchor protein AmaP [Bacillota bacterium]
MRAYDRVVVFVSALLLLGTGAIFLAMAFGPNPTRLFTDLFLTGPFQSLRPATIGGASAAVLAGVYLFWLSIRGRGRRKPIIRGTSLGEVRISSLAVESLVRRAAKEVHGIQDVDTLVDTSGDNLEIFVSVVVSPDLSIPEVAEQIQTKLSRYIGDTVGVDVSRVSVNVRNVGHEQKPARVV